MSIESTQFKIHKEEGSILDFKSWIKTYYDKLLREKSQVYSFDFVGEQVESDSEAIAKITPTKFLSRKRSEENPQKEQVFNSVNSFKAKLKERLLYK